MKNSPLIVVIALALGIEQIKISRKLDQVSETIALCHAAEGTESDMGESAKKQTLDIPEKGIIMTNN